MEKGFKVHRFDYDEGPEVGGDFEQAARHGLEIALKDIRENRLSGARVTKTYTRSKYQPTGPQTVSGFGFVPLNSCSLNTP